jgi:hypothetical protein
MAVATDVKAANAVVIILILSSESPSSLDVRTLTVTDERHFDSRMIGPREFDTECRRMYADIRRQ